MLKRRMATLATASALALCAAVAPTTASSAEFTLKYGLSLIHI